MKNFKKYNKINIQIILSLSVQINKGKQTNPYFKINIKANILKKRNQFRIQFRRSNKYKKLELFSMQVISMLILLLKKKQK